ncbi:P-loop ATPase, Sll1717 family [Staphylococcus sp. IPLA37010]|uniref:KAP NTPase domain-containing protein n=1 Tax=Staphylococcus equorum TaxID=246432 RepID=A0AAW7AKH1_9STAP|nr:hypothetical protein [Staphylococcus equorum]MDK9867278.1 hypothetical protein [Staphylococcus equorum]
MKLKDFTFGFADAEKEYSREREIFKYSFYDPKNIIDQLLNSQKFMIVGRKGVGKTAFLSKIKYLSNQDDNLYTYALKLNDFEYSTFSKTSIEKNTMGTQKYKDSWDFLMLLLISKILYENFSHYENEELLELLAFLEEIGFNNFGLKEYKRDIKQLTKLKKGINVKGVGASFEKEFGYKPDSFVEQMSMLNSKIIDVITNSYNGYNNAYILIDGLDDILRYKKEQLDILTSLIRSVNYLNDKFFEESVGFKIILSIREDILDKVTDPDLNKIKRDGAVRLDWSKNVESLKSIVELRLMYLGIEEKKANEFLGNLFPKKFRTKDSWDYILDHTLYKPRDILQFMITCQELFPENDYLTFSKLKTTMKSYSNDYFINEMKDELSGFSDDEMINSLPQIFKSIGSKKFSFAEFKQHFNNQYPSKNIEDSELRLLLITLYNSGYLGQLIYVGKQRKASVNFKYRNPNTTLDIGSTFIIHQGIQYGLGVRL